MSLCFTVSPAHPKQFSRTSLCVPLAIGLVACQVDDRILSQAQPIIGDSGRLETGGVGGTPSTGPSTGGALGSGGAQWLEDGASGGSSDSGGSPEYDGGCWHVGPDGKPDCGATIVTNADFNVDAHDWAQADAFGFSKWKSVDSQGATGSGSLSVTNTYTYDASGMGPAAVAQCVPVTGGKVYDFGAAVFIAGGQSYGLGQVAVWFYPTDDCSGAPDQAYVAGSSDVTGAWTPVSGSLIAPSTDFSMSVRLGAEKPFRATQFEAVFDAIRVMPQ